MDISKQALRSTRDQAPPTRLATFVDIVRWQAERIGSWEAFRFLVPAVQSESSIDYTTLDLRIRSVAARLMAAGRPGQRVLVVQQPGMEYIVSLFGCLYAGMVAVPVYPVDVFRLRQTLPRLQAITRDADAAILLTSAEALGITEQRLDGDNSPDQTASGDRLGPLWDLCHQASLLTDQIDIACADDYRPPAIGAHDLAILQYTSGTTASPRGVALQHRQLMANAKQIYDAYHVPDAVCVFWLPPYHDMGLVGGLLLPVFAGRSSVLMSPMSFVQNPISWLEAISTHRGTTTASPNFGYELCLRKIKPEQLESLDLSSLRVAISGAEPIRATTLCNFQQRFAECGLRDTALTPAYGMAEATLAITGKSLETAPRIVAFSATRLHGEMPCGVRATSVSDSSNVVSCGVPLQGTEVHVVDPDTRRILPEGHVGEIWVSGPSVATQYWRKPQLSQTTFNATAQDAFVNRNNQSLPYAPVTFLRTGDLGFFYQNELYVSGRLKDLIILSGKNYFAHELEATIQGSHEALKVDGGVAFGCSFGDVDEERLVIVQEVLRPKRFCLDELVHIIRRALAQQHDLYPAAIVLLPAATLNKTSSGKLQRGDCVSRFLGGAFEPLLRWDASSPSLPLKWSSVFEAETDDGLSWHPPAEPEGGQAAEPSIRDQIAKIWTEVLDLPHAAPDQHFLDVGGHSLAALSLLSRLRERLGVVLEFDALFQAPRFADFCEVVGQAIGEVPTSSHYRATSQANISRHALTSDTRLPPHRPQLQGEPDVTTWPPNRLEPRFSTDEAVPTAPHRQSYPLTATQRRFWISQQMEQQQAFLHVELTLHLIGTIDQPALLNAFEQLPERHEALRSHFVVDELGDVQQKFADSVRLQPIWIDWRSDDSHHSDWQQRLADFRRSLIGQPFETLANAPLLRAAVLALPDGKTQILLVAHHVVCDATSLAIIANDLAEYYSQATNPASRDLANHNESSLDARNHSWTRWLQQYSADTFQDTDDCYWSSRLSGYRGDARLLLPEVNSKRSSTSDSSQRLDPSASYTLRLPSQLVEQLKSRCLQWNVTLFEALLAGWHEVLSRYSEESDLVLGVPVAQRTDSWSEFCVGCLINLLPIRLQAPAELSEATYASRVSAVSQLWRSDWRHAPAPLEKLALETGSKRQSNRLPMIQHLFLFQPPVQAVLRFGEVECDRYSSDYSTLGAYDTALVVQQQRDTNGYTHLELTLAYSPACLTEETARQMLGGISTWLDSALADPTLPLVQLPASNPSQLEHLAHSFQAKHWNSRHRTVMDLFGDQLNKTPDAVVAIDIDGAFTFRELDQTSTRFAKQLAASGVAPGDVVALQLSRNRQILVAALAVWKAGAAYLPLDPAYPVQRIQDVLQDALPRLVLTDVELQRLSQLDIDTSLPVPGTPDDLAYLIYTSGSTGKPKGVAIGHDNLANVLLAFAKGMGVSSGSRILASTTISFDISVLELFLPLVTGATSVIAPASLSSDVDRVISWLHTHPIDIVQATPSSLRMLQAAGWQPNARMTVWCGGEAMQTDLACWILDCGCRLWNVYGPTETTVWSLVCEMDRQSLDQSPWVSIGRPIDSTAIRIVRPSGADSPIGVPGELWIGGLGVGKGYWNRSQLTEQRFVTCSIPQYHSVEHAVSSMRMYRTGDLVRMHSDGNLEFLGRLDRQVKLRGHRIELGEIENALQLSDLVRESAVVLLGSEGKERLAAFYRPARMDDHDATVDSLRSHLAFHRLNPWYPVSGFHWTSFPRRLLARLITARCRSIVHSSIASASKLITPSNLHQRRSNARCRKYGKACWSERFCQRTIRFSNLAGTHCWLLKCSLACERKPAFRSRCVRFIRTAPSLPSPPACNPPRLGKALAAKRSPSLLMWPPIKVMIGCRLPNSDCGLSINWNPTIRSTTCL